jgi:lysophosphatidate acyltransferase
MWDTVVSLSRLLLRFTLLSTAFLVTLTLALYMLSFLFPKAAFGARAVASYLSLMLASAIGILGFIPLAVLGATDSGQWLAGRAFALLMRFVTGVVFDVQDPHGYLASTRPAILVGNHQTELDVLMLGSIFPQHCAVTAKASLRRVPLLGWFMSLSKTIFIDRGNAKDARQAMKGAAHEIRRRNQSVYIFPEGTRSYSKDAMLLPFKKGAFHLAVEAQVPIVPCVVANYSHVLWVRGLVFRSGRIPVKGMLASFARPVLGAL